MLLKDKNAREIEELKQLLNRLIDLVYLQAKEIDIIHFKLFMLKSQPEKALEVLSLSKNIEPAVKTLLQKEAEDAKEKQEAIEEGKLRLLQEVTCQLTTAQEPLTSTSSTEALTPVSSPQTEK